MGSAISNTEAEVYRKRSWLCAPRVKTRNWIYGEAKEPRSIGLDWRYQIKAVRLRGTNKEKFSVGRI